MIYSAIVGFILGFNHTPFILGGPVLVALIVLKGLAEILYRKNLFTGTPSPYVLYVEQRRNPESRSRSLWRGYLFQVILFGSLIGFAVYAIFFFWQF